MEEERAEMFGPPNMVFITKGNRPKGNKSSRGRQAMKGSHLPQKDRPKRAIAKNQKAKGNRENNIARVKCYKCDNKGHYARDCPEPQKIREQVNI